jgi:hypothetical protein
MRAAETGEKAMFDDQRTRLLEALEVAHSAYYKKEILGGPSLYFHVQSLDAARERQFDRFAECTYSMLAAWGMHRMGSGGSKMREFDEYQSSLKKIWPLSLQLREKTPSELAEEDWNRLKNMFCELRCMATGTSLVGNSKVLAHLLPNLVPPVDREYTLTFLFRNKQITNDLHGEWGKLRQMLQEFFYPVVQVPLFQTKADEWLAQGDRFRWDTSKLKILDNVMIGLSAISRSEKETGRSGKASA